MYAFYLTSFQHVVTWRFNYNNNFSFQVTVGLSSFGSLFLKWCIFLVQTKRKTSDTSIQRPRSLQNLHGEFESQHKIHFGQLEVGNSIVARIGSVRWKALDLIPFF